MVMKRREGFERGDVDLVISLVISRVGDEVERGVRDVVPVIGLVISRVGDEVERGV